MIKFGGVKFILTLNKNIMKKLILLLSVFFVLAACGSNKDKGSAENDEATDTEETTSKDTKSGNSECDKFLDDYEKWADEVVELYKKAKENPMDMGNMQKIAESSQKMAEWSTKWGELVDCAQTEKYAKRMEEIQEKVNKAMEE